jgi:hypothetical protein
VEKIEATYLFFCPCRLGDTGQKTAIVGGVVAMRHYVLNGSLRAFGMGIRRYPGRVTVGREGKGRRWCLFASVDGDWRVSAVSAYSCSCKAQPPAWHHLTVTLTFARCRLAVTSQHSAAHSQSRSRTRVGRHVVCTTSFYFSIRAIPTIKNTRPKW